MQYDSLGLLLCAAAGGTLLRRFWEMIDSATGIERHLLDRVSNALIIEALLKGKEKKMSLLTILLRAFSPIVRIDELYTVIDPLNQHRTD